MSSRCKQCGEGILDNGNYTFRIIPAKRIPRKGRKLMVKARKGDNVLECSSNEDATSFQKFLMKRAKSANHIAMTCGKCGAQSKIKMLKRACDLDLQKISSEDNDNIKAPTATTSRKRKRTKEKNAGLTIPVPGNSHSSSASTSSTSTDSKVQSEGTSMTIPKAKPVLPMQQKAKSPFQKQKDMDKLKKILFDSKKAKKSGSSLQDFLSSI